MRLTTAQLHKLQIRSGEKPVEREADLQSAIVAELKARRIYFVQSRMDKAPTNGIGTPDFIIALPDGKALWIECKTAKGKLSREQAGVALLLKIAGHRHEVVRSMPEFFLVMENVPELSHGK